MAMVAVSLRNLLADDERPTCCANFQTTIQCHQQRRENSTLQRSLQEINQTTKRTSSMIDKLRHALTPTRFGESYTHDQAKGILHRLPFFVAGSLFVVATSPIGGIRIHGPSMLPTMAADESDIWIIWKDWGRRPAWCWNGGIETGTSRQMLPAVSFTRTIQCKNRSAR